MDEHEDIDDGSPDNQDYVPYVTGATLSQMSGRKVRCWGRVTPASGSDLTIKTVDDATLTLKLKIPMGNIPTTWIEAVGLLQGRTMICDNLIVFPEEACADVDEEGHRSLVQLLATLDDPWNLGENENGITHME